jgi:hypothetical protein
MGGNGSGVTGGGSLGIDLGTSMAFMQASQQAQQAQALQRMRMVQFQLALQQQQLAQQQAQFERLKQLRRAARATSTIREHRRIRGDRATTVAESAAQTRTILVLSPRDKG